MGDEAQPSARKGVGRKSIWEIDQDEMEVFIFIHVVGCKERKSSFETIVKGTLLLKNK